jgi:hypothetical protein
MAARRRSLAQLKAVMRIPDVRPEDRGSIVRVVLRDTTMADALHPTVAEATGVVDPVRDEVEVTLEVPREGLDRRHRYSVWAHVDHEGTGQPRAGDLITTQNVAVTPEDVDGRAVQVPLSRI